VDRLGAEIKQQLSRFGAQGAMAEVVELWPEAVGEAIAANAWPARIARDGTLHVNTSSSTWAFELAHLSPAILERLGEKLGGGAPKAMRFAAGHLPEPPLPAAPERRPEAAEPSAEALHHAAELAAEIEDGDLRELVARAAALSLSNARSDLSF
jgi:predicted nucleic acid-binding Zn ribbon protein